MKHIKLFEGFEINDEKNEKPEPKYKKGDKVKYLPKMSGLSPNKVFVVKSSKWKDSDELSKAFGVEWKPTWVYYFEDIALSAIENDIKGVK